MSLILPQETTIYYTEDNASYYLSLGYKDFYDTNNKRSFKISVSDLNVNSYKYVWVQCDICDEKLKVKYHNYIVNINKNNGMYICKNSKRHYKLTLEDSIKQINRSIFNYYKLYNKFPIAEDFKKVDTLPDYYYVKRILKEKNYTVREYLDFLNPNIIKFDINSYKTYLDEFKRLVGKGKLKPTKHDMKYNTYNLPIMEWFIDNCPNKNIKTKEDFLEYAGVENVYITKEETVRRIYKMAEYLNRPLMYDDFRGDIKENSINLTYVRNYWGTLNKMKEDLGLEIMQESMMDKHKDGLELENDIINLCNKIYNIENRKTITITDIDNSEFCLNSQSYRKYFKENKTTLRKYIENLGFILQAEGTGLNYIFEDGEKTMSRFELEFSKFLRKNGFVYNNDYFRDVKYNTFIKTYKGLLNCDYVLNLNNQKIYIEIVGLIDRYKDNYYNNIPINNSKSKEKYRNKLMEKEKMFQDNKLDYYIVFPEDLDDFKIKLKEVIKDDRREENC